MRVSDWIGVNCGDLIEEKGNPRHIGRVQAVISGINVKVRWLGTNWVSVLDLSEVVVIEKAKGRV